MRTTVSHQHFLAVRNIIVKTMVFVTVRTKGRNAIAHFLSLKGESVNNVGFLFRDSLTKIFLILCGSFAVLYFLSLKLLSDSALKFLFQLKQQQTCHFLGMSGLDTMLAITRLVQYEPGLRILV